jgi:hypothetical protein
MGMSSPSSCGGAWFPQAAVDFAVGVLAVSKQRDAAQALVKFMSSREAAPLIRKSGMEPPPRWRGHPRTGINGADPCPVPLLLTLMIPSSRMPTLSHQDHAPVAGPVFQEADQPSLLRFVKGPTAMSKAFPGPAGDDALAGFTHRSAG